MVSGWQGTSVLHKVLGNEVDVVRRGRNSALNKKLTREGFLKAAGAGAAWIALASLPGCERNQARSDHPPLAQTKHTVWTFRSRPDLSPPLVEVNTQAREVAPGYIFLAPKRGHGPDGPMIIDDSGQPVWFLPLRRKDERALPFEVRLGPSKQGVPAPLFDAQDFKVQQYRGEPVLTWWQGAHTEYGQGEYVIVDSSYREITRVRAGNGYRGDLHEFLITPEDTALLTVYGRVYTDLSSLGGPKDGFALEGIVQEVDIKSGEVLFEWHSLEHVGLEESYFGAPKEPEYGHDYFHINSIDIDHDNNLLVSARKTSTVYKIDHKSGEVTWRLGGKKSDFEMGPGTRTRFQHDARRQRDGTITIFDNGGKNVAEQSRGIVVELDEDAMTATLVREYTHPDELLAATQANVQVLPNGNVFIGWGSKSVFSEFSRDGELLFDASLATKQSYRTFRFPWSGQPSDDPAMVAERGPGDKVRVYASWNGATEVATWEVLAGPGSERLKPVRSAPREGFETTITVRTTEPYIGVRAKDRSGRVLGTAKAVEPGG